MATDNGTTSKRSVFTGMSLEDAFRARGWTVTSTGCWEWAGSINGQGYGQISIKHLGIMPGRAHRISYEVFVGPIPGGMVIRHKCDNPPCVNPDHLEQGTTLDNVRDKMDRNRGPYWYVRTMCRNGHDLSTPGVDGLRNVKGKPSHYCTVCERANKDRKNARNRARRAETRVK